MMEPIPMTALSKMGDYELPFDRNRFRVKECPCGKDNKDGKFTPFVDHDAYGYCYSCGITFYPDNTIKAVRPSIRNAVPSPSIPIDIFSASMQGWDDNNLIKYLRGIFPKASVESIIRRYKIGSDGHKWKGSSVLWYIDRQMTVRAGKVILFDAVSGKRMKEPFPHQSWIHSLYPMPSGYELRHCFYGEHLLSDRSRPVAIVEAERTAIVMSEKMPDYIWISSGGKNGLTASRWKSLSGRDVILFPDSGDGYILWKELAKEMMPYVKSISVDDQVQRHAKGMGNLDLLDLIDIRQERKKESPLSNKADQPSGQIDPNHRRKVRQLFPFFLGGNVLNHKEAINAIIYNIRQYDPMKDRMKPPTFEHIQMAEKALNDMIESGAIIKTDSGHYHAFDYQMPEINIKLISDSKSKEKWPVDELRSFFNSASLPDSIRLDRASMISNVQSMVSNHLNIIDKNNGTPAFLPYYERLTKLKGMLIAMQ
jgi:hypothetical protein